MIIVIGLFGLSAIVVASLFVWSRWDERQTILQQKEREAFTHEIAQINNSGSLEEAVEIAAEAGLYKPKIGHISEKMFEVILDLKTASILLGSLVKHCPDLASEAARVLTALEVGERGIAIREIRRRHPQVARLIQEKLPVVELGLFRLETRNSRKRVAESIRKRIGK